MKINLSINKNIVNKGKAGTPGWENAQLTARELLDHILQGFAFSQGVIKEGHNGEKPTKDDIEYAHLLPIDIDNDIKDPVVGIRKRTEQERYLSFDVVINNPWIKQHCLFVYTTASHTEEHHKFRMVFLLPEPIFDMLDYTNTAKAFINRAGGDLSCSNIDRLFYGNQNAKHAFFGGTLTHEDLIQVIDGPKKEQEAVKEYKDSGLNGSMSPDLIAEMLRCIPVKQDYDTWFKIVSAVGNYFSHDLELARSLIDDWSPDDERGTMYRLKHRGAKVGIGTLIYHAHLNGFDKSKIYRKREKGLSKHSVNSEGKISKKKKGVDVQEIKDYLSEHYLFRYNIIKSYVEFKHKSEPSYIQLVDRHENSLWCELKEKGFDITGDALTRILSSDFIPEYNPFKEYFSSLPEWDGFDHIGTFVDAVVVEESQKDHWRDYFTRWIVSAVACAIEAPRRDGKGRSVNHTCIVLVGGQGIGKTTIINRLIPSDLLPYYAIAQINPNDKDSKVLVTEAFIINLDELESSTREEIASLKSLMTSEQISLRKPYARRAEVFMRRASFIGSVNKAMFLTDITGARRFLPVDVLSINLDVDININQLYAQAMEYLDYPDFKYWFFGEEIEKINELNKKYQIASPEEELLLKYFTPYEGAELTPEEIKTKESAGVMKCLTATEIYDALQRNTEARISHVKLGQFLKNLGFHQRSIKFGKTVKRVYFVSKIDANENEEKINF